MTFPRRHPLVFLLALVAASGGVVACGGDDEDNGGGGEPLSQQEFVSKADAACQKSNQDNPPPAPPKSQKDAAEQAGEEADVREELAGELDDLTPPEDKRELFDDYKSKTGDIIEAIRAQADAGDDSQAFNRATFELNTLAVQRSKLATQLGFKVCAQPQGSQQPLGDAEFVKQADAICKEVNDKFLDATPKEQKPGDLKAAAKFYDETADDSRKSFEEIKALKPPAKDEEAWKDFLAAFEKRIALTGNQQLAAETNNQKMFENASQDDSKEQQKEASAAQALGFEVCGANGTAGI